MPTVNPYLLQLVKNGFVPPAPQDPSQGGGDPNAAAGQPPPMDPSQAGGAPPMDPSQAGGMPPGAPPAGGDPAAGGGGGGDIVALVQQVVQQTLQAQQAAGGGAAGGAPGARKSGGKGGDELAHQQYKTNVILTAIVNGLNKAGIEVIIPPETLLGLPPGADAGAALSAMPQPGQQPQDPSQAGAAPADPSQGGGDPSQQAGGQVNFSPSLAMPKAGEVKPLGETIRPMDVEKTANDKYTDIGSRAGALLEMVTLLRKRKEMVGG